MISTQQKLAQVNFLIEKQTSFREFISELAREYPDVTWEDIPGRGNCPSSAEVNLEATQWEIYKLNEENTPYCVRPYNELMGHKIYGRPHSYVVAYEFGKGIVQLIPEWDRALHEAGITDSLVQAVRNEFASQFKEGAALDSDLGKKLAKFREIPLHCLSCDTPLFPGNDDFETVVMRSGRHPVNEDLEDLTEEQLSAAIRRICAEADVTEAQVIDEVRDGKEFCLCHGCYTKWWQDPLHTE